MAKLKGKLLEQMQAGGWPVTFSIGALTCHEVPDTTDRIVSLVDGLMYDAKRSGRNAIRCSAYPLPGVCKVGPAKSENELNSSRRRNH
jgi:hypothetical protein